MTKIIVLIKNLIKREINYYRIKPTYALLFITYRCTSKCKMCAMWQRKVEIKDELTLEDWKKVIDKLKQMQINHIEFFGGDALIRKDILIPLVKYAHDKGIYTEMPTNCNLLDEDTVSALIKAGINDIWISLDGVEKTHDTIRGKTGTFKKVDYALKAINKYRINSSPQVFFNCVISKTNYRTFHEIIPYAVENHVYGIDFEYVGEINENSIKKTKIDNLHPTPFFLPTSSSLLLNIQEAEYLKSKLKKIKKKYKGKDIHINTSKIDILSTKEMASGRFPNKRCYICRDWVTIDPYGNLIGCLHFNNYIIGNVKETSLQELWKGYNHLRFIETRDNGNFDICNYCSNGAIRNNTLFQNLQIIYFELLSKCKK